MNSKPIEDQLSDNSSDEWSSAEELDDWMKDLSDILCLFCNKTFGSIDKCLEHMKSCHDLDLIDVCVGHRLDSIAFVKLVNYIRVNGLESTRIRQTIESKLSESEEYMKPFISDDQLLTFDIESQYNDCDNELMADTSSHTDPGYEHLSPTQLIHKLRHSEDRIKGLEKQLSDLKSLVNSYMSDESVAEQHLNVSRLSASEDSHYIDSYSHFAIHYDMLSDKCRTKAYEEWILKNDHFFKDKTVLDIGCGTGILSLFAAKAGARLVVAVDQSDVVYKAMDIAVENGFDSNIRFIKNKVESIEWDSYGLPDKYDIIISEWMGYFLLFEGMLDSILYARDCLLNESGVLLPNRTTLSIAGVCDPDLRNRFINFWDNVYGFKMSSMKREVLSEAMIECVSRHVIHTNVCVIKDLDLNTCSTEETQSFETNFQLMPTSNEPMVAIVGWFDCSFIGQHFRHEVVLSTSPFADSTHWKQTLFLLRQPIICKIGHKIDAKIKVYRNIRDVRSLVIELVIASENKQIFSLS